MKNGEWHFQDLVSHHNWLLPKKLELPRPCKPEDAVLFQLCFSCIPIVLLFYLICAIHDGSLGMGLILISCLFIS